MKKTTFAVLLSLICASVLAQDYEISLSAVPTKKIGGYPQGQTIQFKALRHYTDQVSSTYSEEHYQLVLTSGDIIECDSKTSNLDFNINSPQDYWDVAIIQKVVPSLIKSGTQTSLRADMESDALEYISTVQSHGLEFVDPYLESYIYGIISKIAPTTMIDGRPGNVNILIQESPEMNAGMYPNGTLIINTGLIAALHSEDELAAILAHEIAHFVLDHSIKNVNAAYSRQKRAEFWAGVATAVTAVAEVSVAANKAKHGNYYAPGAATIAVAAASTLIASQVIDRLGMKYNNAQELEADQTAIDILRYAGYDVSALATALTRIKDIMIEERNNAMYFASYSHPALMTRIHTAGVPKELVDKNFEKIISFAVTSTARMKYDNRRFSQSLVYSTQNINNGIATAEDYILRAKCLLNLYNDETTSTEALTLLNKAQEINGSDVNIYKTKIVTLLRQNNKSAAIKCLQEYNEALALEKNRLASINNDAIWGDYFYFFQSEENWTNKMLIKLQGM